jgi:hypothetical protein
MILMSPAQAAKLPEAIEAVTAGVEPAPYVHMLDERSSVYVVAMQNAEPVRAVSVLPDGHIVDREVD